MSNRTVRALGLVTVLLVGGCDCGSATGGGALTLAWLQAAQTVSEADGVVSARVVLSRPAQERISVTVDVAGDAMAPDDHDLISGETLIIEPGSSEVDLTFTLVDDIWAEGTETLSLTLVAPSAGMVTAPMVHTISIEDNESELTLISPNGGEIWIAGDTETIRWVAAPGVGNVDLEYTIDGAATWQGIASNVDVPGEFLWEVPTSPSTAAAVRIVAASGSLSDQSDSAFEIRVPANRWYVDNSRPVAGDGTTWQSAFLEVQAAAAAAAAGDEVWVAGGVYYRRGSEAVLLPMKEGVLFLGGFAGDEAERHERDPATHITVLDGEGTVDHVVVGASQAVLDGFSVTGGHADGSDADAHGGGMINLGLSSTMIRRCWFHDNHADQLGGGLFASECDGLLVESTRFSANDASDLSGSRVDSPGGGAIAASASKLLIRDCAIESNAADGGSGGLLLRDGTTVVASTLIADNSDGGSVSAGGLAAFGREQTTLVDCILARNHGAFGALLAAGNALALRRSLLHDNRAELSGSAIFAALGHVEIRSSTLVRQENLTQPGVLDGTGAVFEIVNSLLWDNLAPGDDLFGNNGSSYVVRFSNLQPASGYTDGGNNLSAAPNFVDPTIDDFRIGQASPAIDAGDAGQAFSADLLGQRRVDDPGTPDSGSGVPPVDLGAFEFVGVSRLRLLAPNGGELWDVGTAATITWQSDGSIAAVRIEVSCDGAPWREVVASTAAAAGSHFWDPVTGPGGAACRIRVADVADAAVWDVSDGSLTLLSDLVWHVDSGASLPGDGSSWAAAFSQLQDGIDAASYGDEVRVAGGVYGLVRMKRGVDLLGGWSSTTGLRDIAANPTQLDGQGAGTHVVIAATATLDGFIVENGQVDGASGFDGFGGGMLIAGVSPTVNRCLFRNNNASFQGGAIYINGPEAAPLIQDSRFENNRAVNGGCLFATDNSRPTIEAVEFVGCRATVGYGGAVGSNDGAQPTFVDCRFATNRGGNGGALGLFAPPELSVIDHCDFVDNVADQNGGAIQIVDGRMVCVDSWFQGNVAATRGGAVYAAEFASPTAALLTSSVLLRNSAAGDDSSHGGGAIYAANAAATELRNCTSFENAATGTAGVGGAVFVGGGSVDVVNSILWDDMDSSAAVACPIQGADSAELYLDAGTATILYSNVANRCEAEWPGTGNLDADPSFVDTGATPDLRLRDDSPCIDRAHGDYAPDTDHDGRQRYDHVSVDAGAGEPSYADIGAFEFEP